MDHPLEPATDLTPRCLRRWFLAYRREAYPQFGEGRLPCLNYCEFRQKVRQHAAMQEELRAMYTRFPSAASAPADDRTRMVHLEAQASHLERELCMS
jgi:hypothetical protein